MAKRTTWIVAAALGAMVAAAAGAQGPAGRGPMGPGPHGRMCGGPGAMGSGMMTMGCPLMTPGADLKVENVENGVTITLTSSDPKEAARIQKRAEILRLLHELEREEP